jgi:hypothetical protein
MAPYPRPKLKLKKTPPGAESSLTEMENHHANSDDWSRCSARDFDRSG